MVVPYDMSSVRLQYLSSAAIYERTEPWSYEGEWNGNLQSLWCSRDGSRDHVGYLSHAATSVVRQIFGTLYHMHRAGWEGEAKHVKPTSFAFVKYEINISWAFFLIHVVPGVR